MSMRADRVAVPGIVINVRGCHAVLDDALAILPVLRERSGVVPERRAARTQILRMPSKSNADPSGSTPMRSRDGPVSR